MLAKLRHPIRSADPGLESRERYQELTRVVDELPSARLLGNPTPVKTELTVT